MDPVDRRGGPLTVKKVGRAAAPGCGLGLCGRLLGRGEFLVRSEGVGLRCGMEISLEIWEVWSCDFTDMVSHMFCSSRR